MNTHFPLIALLLGAVASVNAGVFRNSYYYDYWGLESGKSSDSSNDKVWRFMIGDNWGAFEYLDANGYMKGFHPDLIKAVCDKAGKTCYWAIDAYKNCWNTDEGLELPGKGLMGGWYDGCVGLFPTPERQNSFNFTKAWSPQPAASLFYRKGDFKGDISDLSGRKIGLMNGWALSRTCLARERLLNGNQPGDYEAVFFNTVTDIVDGLLKKKIDAFLLGARYDGEAKGIMRAGPFITCATAGNSIMARYGDPLIEWWNTAFDDMVESGEFNDLCKQAGREHGIRGRINCI